MILKVRHIPLGKMKKTHRTKLIDITNLIEKIIDIHIT